MHGIKRLILSALLFAVVFSGTTASAAATSLPAGVLIGDQDGITCSQEGEYYIDATGLQAGDVLTKQVTIRNTEPYTYKISMTADPMEETGPLKLLDEIHLNLKLNGKTLYDGRVRGDEGVNMILNALDLGTYTSGDTAIMDITLTVNPEMQKYWYTSSEAWLRWNFYAARPDEGKDGPKTGEMVTYGMYILGGCLLGTSLVLLISKKKQEQQDEPAN